MNMLVFGFCRLKKLKFASNKLIELPEDIIKMPGLEELDLHDNLLEFLPQNVNKFPKLKKLDISDNKIMVFPMKFDKLKEVCEVRNMCQFSCHLNCCHC